MLLFRKSSPICSSVFPITSWSCFKVSGHALRSLIHFELILVQGERQGSSFSLLHLDIQFSQQHLLNRLSFFITCFRLLSQKSIGYSFVDLCLGPETIIYKEQRSIYLVALEARSLRTVVPISVQPLVRVSSCIITWLRKPHGETEQVHFYSKASPVIIH
jgi:hypothetical protein